MLHHVTLLTNCCYTVGGYSTFHLSRGALGDATDLMSVTVTGPLVTVTHAALVPFR